jgi:hypothetical protein
LTKRDKYPNFQQDQEEADIDVGVKVMCIRPSEGDGTNRGPTVGLAGERAGGEGAFFAEACL